MAKKTKRLKATVAVLSVVLVMLMSVAGTLAYLKDSTDPVENTFTSSDISITLTESATEFKMVPGHTIAKDPKITVASGSEACYVFVKVAATNGVKLASQTIDPATDYITYTMETGWYPLESVEGVYYYEVDAVMAKAGMEGYVLNDNKVQVLPTVTKAMMQAIDGKGGDAEANAAELAKQPKLTFTAYAIQMYKDNNTKFSPAEAWEQVDNAG